MDSRVHDTPSRTLAAMDAFSDLAFFILLVKRGSLAGAAQQLGLTPSAASKRLAALEDSD